MSQVRNFIDGKVQEPHSKSYKPILAPATGEILGEAAISDSDDVEEAYRAAHQAQPAWSALGVSERAKFLKSWSKNLRENVDELSLMDAKDSGTPRRTMRAGVLKGADAVDFFCGLGPELKGETFPVTPSGLHFTRREPYGVVGSIIPFNHPSLFALSKTAAALVAGNTVVLKPAEQTPMTAELIARLSEGHLPPGVFNVVQGEAAAGDALVRHPNIWRLQFTGGVKTGLSVLRASAESGRAKHVGLEMGGKNPLIAFPDADLETVADAVVTGMNFTRNQGQSCGSTSRLFVHKDVVREMTEAVLDRVKRIKLGLPEEEQTEMGSLVSSAHQERVLGFIGIGREEGARICCGGGPPEGSLSSGAYVLPTVLDKVDPSMKVAQEEIFGPVLSIISWEDEDSMFEAVNGVLYGLTAAIYSNDINTALRAAAKVESGYVWVNGVEMRWIGVPFGGYKNSGIGTEYSLEELFSYTRSKTVNVIVPS